MDNENESKPINKTPKETSNAQCKNHNNTCVHPVQTRKVKKGCCHCLKIPSCNCFTMENELNLDHDKCQCKERPNFQICPTVCYIEEAERGIPKISCVDACRYSHINCPENYTFIWRKFNKITLVNDCALEFINSLSHREKKSPHKHRKRCHRGEKLTNNACAETNHRRLPSETCKTLGYTSSHSYNQPATDCMTDEVPCGQLYSNKCNMQMASCFPYPYHMYPSYCYCPCPYSKNQIGKDTEKQVGAVKNKNYTKTTQEKTTKNKNQSGDEKVNSSTHSTSVNLSTCTVENCLKDIYINNQSDKLNMVSEILDTLNKNKISPTGNKRLQGPSPTGVTNSKRLPQNFNKPVNIKYKSTYTQQLSPKEVCVRSCQQNLELKINKKGKSQSKEQKTKRPDPPSTVDRVRFHK